MWTADIAIDAALALQLVDEQFPQLAATRAEPFGSGWDNAAFLIDDTVVFRFPRRRVAAALIAREAAILPLIASHLPLAVPVPTFIGTGDARYPSVFGGYVRLDGVTACSAALTDDERIASAPLLGRFLRRLHAIDVEPLRTCGLEPDTIGRLDHPKRLAISRERVATLAGAGFAQLASCVAWLAAHPAAPVPPERRTLVHGDLYARHILIGAERRPTGVIDWGDLHLGDPAIDLALAHLMLPPDAHAAFRDAYGPIDDRTWSVARYRAVYHALVELEYGIRTGDGAMRDIGLTALRFLGEF
jgi:aminoglycoside phosphotransferase (APT) family kinase protein